MPAFWDLLIASAAPAATNMGVDEALLRTATQRDRPLLRLYSWDRLSVSFGYFQKFPADLAGRYAVVRRPTGGGIVYHGDGVDTTYTVVVPPGHPLHKRKTDAAYCVIHQAVAAALALQTPLCDNRAPQRGQYECFQNPVAGDVVADGRKLAGGAQRRSRAGMLHQGSIAASISAEQLVAGFRKSLAVEFQPFELSPATQTLAEKLALEKYATAGWNQRL